MKKIYVLVGALALSLSGAVGSIAQASTPPSVSIDQALVMVLKTIQSKNFVALEVERERDGFDTKVIDQEGVVRPMRFDLAGNMLPPPVKHVNHPVISMLEAVELLTKAGYTQISEIRAHHQFYDAEALSPMDKKEVDVKVNAMTGDIQDLR